MRRGCSLRVASYIILFLSFIKSKIINVRDTNGVMS